MTSPIAKPYEDIKFKGKYYPIVTRHISSRNLWPFGKYLNGREERKDIDSPGYKAEGIPISVVKHSLFNCY